MNELMQSRVSLGMHAAIALLMGWFSIEIAAMSRSLFAVVIGFVVLYFTGTAAQRVTRQRGIKWWAANGMVVYLFIWFISWTVFFNLA